MTPDTGQPPPRCRETEVGRSPGAGNRPPLVRRTAVESPEALCTALQPELLGTLTLLLGDRAVAEDLTQETLGRVYARWAAVGRMESPRAWTYRVALNLARSRWRRLGRSGAPRTHRPSCPRASDESNAVIIGCHAPRAGVGASHSRWWS